MSYRARFLVVLFLLGGLAAPAMAGGPAKTKAPARKAERRGLVRGAGHVLGYGAGFGVTAGLALSRTWNAPMRDASGAKVTIESGGRRYTLKARHASVLGPKIRQHADGMSQATGLRRMLRRFVTGFGDGATAAPPAEGRFEAWLHGVVSTAP